MTPAKKALLGFLPVAATACALWLVARDDLASPATPTGDDASNEDPGEGRALHRSASASAQSAPPVDADKHRAQAAAPEANEDRQSLRWDHTTPSTRIRQMRVQLDQAVGALDDDDTANDRQALSQGEAALTAMRADLYATEAGKSDHQRLEAEFTEIAQRVETTVAPLRKSDEESQPQ